MQITFTAEELTLLKDHVLVVKEFYLESKLVEKLKSASVKRGGIKMEITPDNLSAILDAVISQASRTKDSAVQEKLDILNEKLEEVLWSSED